MTMLVKDVMTSNLITVTTHDSLKRAMKLMENLCRRLPVLDENGYLVGIITDRDIRLALNSPYLLRERWVDEYVQDHTTVEGHMTPNPITIDPEASLQEAANLMLSRKISGLPVVDEHTNQLVGIITVSDLMKALISILNRVQA